MPRAFWRGPTPIELTESGLRIIGHLPKTPASRVE